MPDGSQHRAVKSYRERLARRGMARFEVVGLDADKTLIRLLARRLTETGPEADRLRATLQAASLAAPPRPRTGADIMEAFRSSPMMGVDLDLERERVDPRPLDL